MGGKKKPQHAPAASVDACSVQRNIRETTESLAGSMQKTAYSTFKVSTG